MHRTQIYLPDQLMHQLKARSHQEGLSVSEVIRRALEKDIQRDPAREARAWFDSHKPLESFSPPLMTESPEAHVRRLRGKSRLLRNR